MNLEACISIYAGGPGSGCNPEVGRCGRLPLGRKYDPRKIGGFFRKGNVAGNMYESLVREQGQWRPVQHFQEKHTGKANVDERINFLQRLGEASGKWTVERDGDKVRILLNKEVAEKQEMPGSSSKSEQDLSSTPISTKNVLGGGVNKTFLITLKDGTKAVFKEGGGAVPGGEVGAWKVAELVGMEDMVSPTVERTIDGTKGTLALWAPGQPGGRLNEKIAYDGDDVYRAAAFDYVIGNTDRHDGNWVVDDSGKIHLIDHDHTFRKKVWDFGYLFDKAKQREWESKDEGAAKVIEPKDLAAPYVEHKDQIAKVMGGAGLTIEQRIAVQDRIDKLAKAKKWKDLKTEW